MAEQRRSTAALLIALLLMVIAAALLTSQFGWRVGIAVLLLAIVLAP